MRLTTYLITACALAVVLSGCRTPPRESFYTLTPVAISPGSASQSNFRYSVSVGPVKVPEAVDRPQFVIQEGPNRVKVVEQHRWAGSLQNEIARVLTANLNAQLGDARVISHYGRTGDRPTYRVLIDVERFDAVLDDSVTVQAAWTIRPVDSDAPVAGRSTVRKPVPAAGYDGIAAAYGHALAGVSADIAKALRALRDDLPPASTQKGASIRSDTLLR